MKSLYLLIILSQNGAGDINVAFVNTETLHQCQQKAQLVEGIFKTAEIPVIERRCIESSMQFSAFDHTSAAGKIRKFYLVNFDETTVRISAVRDWLTCMKQQKVPAQQGRLYCSSSVQSII